MDPQAQQPTAQQNPVPTTDSIAISSIPAEIPKKVKRFELLMYIGIGLSLLTSSSFFPFLLFGLGLVYLTVRKKIPWARTALTVVVAFGVFSTLLSMGGMLYNFNLIYLIALPTAFIQVYAMWLIYSKEANQWIYGDYSLPGATQPTVSRIWQKTIPLTNLIFLIISAIAVFGVDFIILINSFELLPFWIEMLVVFAVFMIFFYLENYRFKSKFSDSFSWADNGIYSLVLIRNIILFLNFIPFIQIAGALATAVGIIPYIIIYSVLINKRDKIGVVNASTNNSF